MNKVLLALLALCASLPLQARVREISSTQLLGTPENPANHEFGRSAVAIDGDSIIVLRQEAATRSAYLYRRDSAGQWGYERTLLSVPSPANSVVWNVVMKNGIAVVKLDEQATIWEKHSGAWLQAQSASPLNHPGRYVISGSRILVGANGCTDDALILSKRSDGVWATSGEVLKEAGAPCSPTTLRNVEFNYDNAVVRGNDNVLRIYRPAGATIWPRRYAIPLPGQAADNPGWPAMQKNIIVLPGSTYYDIGKPAPYAPTQLQPLDYGNGAGEANLVIYRDGLLLANEGGLEPRSNPMLHAYQLNASGKFEHVATLYAGAAEDGTADLSHDTVVTTSQDYFASQSIAVTRLPTPLKLPRAIANNFDAQDVTGISQTAGSQYALAGNQYNRLLRQNAPGETHAVFAGTDFDSSDEPYVQATINPIGFSGTSPWVALVLRHTDPGNEYLGSVSGSNVMRLYKRHDGQKTLLGQTNLAAPLDANTNLRLSLRGESVSFSVTPLNARATYITATDPTPLKTGKAGFATWRARADFDNFYAAPNSNRLSLLTKDYWYINWARPFQTLGGHWVEGSGDGELLRQSDLTSLALAVNGVATDEVNVFAEMRIDQFGSSDPVAWAGLVARYVDPRNYYYLSVRSSNQVQIRKVVDGVTTVLAAKSLTLPAGEFSRLTFRVVGNELSGYLGNREFGTNRLLVSAIDSDLASGRYGVATYRAAASWQYIDVTQP